ncbi:MAG TPA: hypothetical protein VE242_11600 [Chthoniobacterales bacterium]|nr:hypothetical protein [Chthoniobacterales bacterium]
MAAEVMAPAHQVGQVGRADQVAVMAQAVRAAQLPQAAVMAPAPRVAVILPASRATVIRGVSRKAVIPPATRALPLLQQWAGIRSPMVLVIQAPFEADRNGLTTIVILAPAGGTTIGRGARNTWIGRVIMGVDSLVSSGIDSSLASRLTWH